MTYCDTLKAGWFLLYTSVPGGNCLLPSTDAGVHSTFIFDISVV